jgi:hypothetical protein
MAPTLKIAPIQARHTEKHEEEEEPSEFVVLSRTGNKKAKSVLEVRMQESMNARVQQEADMDIEIEEEVGEEDTRIYVDMISVPFVLEFIQALFPEGIEREDIMESMQKFAKGFPTIRFGQHREFTIAEIWAKYPDYVRWLCKQQWIDKKDKAPWLKHWVDTRFTEETNPIFVQGLLKKRKRKAKQPADSTE